MLFSVESSGLVSGYPYHDGRIISISFPGENIVEISIVSSNRVPHQIQLNGVRYFVANELREGNIINGIYFWSVESAPKNIAQAVAAAFNFSHDEIDRLFSMPGANLFCLECSYGATIYCIFNEFLFRRS